MPTSEDSGRIELDRDVIRHKSPIGLDWTMRIDDVRIIGEATNQNGPFADDYFLCFATGPEMWYEASWDAAGRDDFLAALGARLGVVLQFELLLSTDFASRIVWPLELTDKPMFQYLRPKNWLGRLLGQTRQIYSDHALAALNE